MNIKCSQKQLKKAVHTMKSTTSFSNCHQVVSRYIKLRMTEQNFCYTASTQNGIQTKRTKSKIEKTN